jgi:hypothetical protein
MFRPTTVIVLSPGVFGQFNSADVNKVAEELDRHLQAALQKAAE